jgi:mono/diheme cytochrome c family protein
MKNRYSFLVIVAILFIGSQKSSAQDNLWNAPKFTNSIVNPFKGDAKATEEGKDIFNQMCVLCHGLQGKGNGEAGLTLDQKPANFLGFDVFNQTDGAIFWKITVGKSPMAAYEELLSEDQRWKIVNYIRSLEKK